MHPYCNTEMVLQLRIHPDDAAGTVSLVWETPDDKIEITAIRYTTTQFMEFANGIIYMRSVLLNGGVADVPFTPAAVVQSVKLPDLPPSQEYVDPVGRIMYRGPRTD